MRFNNFLFAIISVGIVAEIILITLAWDKYAEVLVAIGTLALAGVTYYSIRESNKRERNRIQEQKDKEERDRKERLLNEIIEWSEMVSCALGRPAKGNSLEEMKSEETMKIQAGMIKAIRIGYYAEKLDTTLNSKVENAVLLLQRYDARLMGKGQITEHKNRYKLEEDIEDIEPIKSHEEMRDSILELLTALSDVIKSATDKLVPKG